MPEHTLEDGKRWIANLEVLGRALGYLPEPEYNVAQSDEEEAPVDMAWLRSADDPFPLFLFEVETRPTGQMAYNATKVFSQDSGLFEKPLFHFHLVLAGGQSSGKVARTQTMFGAFNYRIYADAAKGSGTEALKDVLSQHRRVSDFIDTAALAGALDAETWPELDLDAIWCHAEECRFRLPWDTEYAARALADEAFIPRLVRKLDEQTRQGDAPSSGSTPVADGCAALIHAGLLALDGPSDVAEMAFERVRAAEIMGQSRSVPTYGESAERDDVVFAQAPAIWAAYAALSNEAGATEWVLRQLELILGPDEQPLDLALSALSAIWMLQVSRACGERYRWAFDRAAGHLNAQGGVSPDLVRNSPGLGGRMDDLDRWAASIAADAQLAPSWEDLHHPPAEAEVRAHLRLEMLEILAGQRDALDGATVHAALWVRREAGRDGAKAEEPAGT